MKIFDIKNKGKDDKSGGISKIIMEDGLIVDVKKTDHVFICKDKDIDENTVEIILSYQCENEDSYKLLSNQCYLMSNVLKDMKISKMKFQEAVMAHNLRMKKAMKEEKEKEKRKNEVDPDPNPKLN